MASQLAQTAKTVKLSLFVLVLFFFAYIIFTQSLSLVSKIIAARQPAKTEPATVGFGRLTSLNLSSHLLAGESPSYHLETITGGLPPLPDKAKVFKFIEPQPTFLALERARGLAKKLGFQTVAKEISPTLYFWQEDEKSLRANTVTNNFEIDTDLTQLTLSLGDLPSPGEITATAKNYLKSRGLLRSGFDLGSQEANLIKKTEDGLSRALSLSEASLARVDFFRAVKEGDRVIPILPTNPKKGLIELYYTGTKGNPFPKIKYTVWDFDFTQSQTYPLRPLTVVWEEIKSNAGFITHLQLLGSDSLEDLDSLNLSEIFIRQVYLAYLDNEKIQKFLQPIYVFEGDGKTGEGQTAEVTIYFPAVDPAWVE